MKTIIKTENAPAPIGPYNQAIVVDNTIYVSGQIAINPKTNILEIEDLKAETSLVLENLKAVLAAGDFTLENVVKCSIFISDMGTFNTINEVYGQYFTNNYPARETVEVSCLPKNVNVEISCVAVK